MDGSIRALAQRNQTAVIRALQVATQQRVAMLIGVSDSTLSTFKDRDIERLAAVLAACGLKVVPAIEQTYTPQQIGALTELAQVGLATLRPTSGWGDLT